MLINPDDYKNYIVLASDDPIEVTLPTQTGHMKMSVKGEIIINRPHSFNKEKNAIPIP